jgi:hypothetical protein
MKVADSGFQTATYFGARPRSCLWRANRSHGIIDAVEAGLLFAAAAIARAARRNAAGPDVPRQRPQAIVPAGAWQAASHYASA